MKRENQQQEPQQRNSYFNCKDSERRGRAGERCIRCEDQTTDALLKSNKQILH